MSRREILKIYHGLPKSITDQHTVFYASLDGTTIPEINKDYNVIDQSNTVFKPALTGNGLYCNLNASSGLKILKFKFEDCLTFDFWAHTTGCVRFYVGEDTNYYVNQAGNRWTSWLRTTPQYEYGEGKVVDKDFNHFRVVFRKNKSVTCYVNGYRTDLTISPSNLQFFDSEYIKVQLFNKLGHDSIKTNVIGGPVFDFHVSNIDRGDLFPTLPQDFIDGEAIIKPNMGQQQIKGDPLCSQETILDVIRPSLDNTYEVVNQVAQANGYYQSLISPELSYSHRTTSWTSGGFKIKGINGELISGITSNGNSPIVTTIDGQVVNGTWSGLGTNEATFSLTSNSGIMSKDLRVIYVLNIPNNNSDFTIMPYSILKVYNSVGDELPLVSDLIITDNFKNRLNYNSVKTTQYATLKTPKEFTDEISDVGYRCLDTNNDDNTFNYASTSPNVKAQNLLSFNLINIIEDAFCGKIPSTDKVGWVKDNVDNIEIFVVGYGNSSTGNRLGITGWCNSENRWYTDIKYHTSSTLNTISYRFHNYDVNKWFNKSIDTNGCLHVNVFAENSDASTQSETNLDYAYITIKMKYDVNFKVYAKNNIYARWNNCNPVLVQSETKTITRYFSSNENFVTESLVYTNNKPGDDIKHNLLLQPPFYYATTMGTGTYNTGSDFYRECLAKLGFDAQSYNFNNSFIQNSTDNKTSSIKIVRGVTQSFSSDTHWSIPYKLETPENCMYLIPSLVNIDNQLCIRLVYREISQSGSTSNKGVKIYKLPNRPLIK